MNAMDGYPAAMDVPLGPSLPPKVEGDLTGEVALVVHDLRCAGLRRGRGSRVKVAWWGTGSVEGGTPLPGPDEVAAAASQHPDIRLTCTRGSVWFPLRAPAAQLAQYFDDGEAVAVIVEAATVAGGRRSATVAASGVLPLEAVSAALRHGKPARARLRVPLLEGGGALGAPRPGHPEPRVCGAVEIEIDVRLGSQSAMCHSVKKAARDTAGDGREYFPAPTADPRAGGRPRAMPPGSASLALRRPEERASLELTARRSAEWLDARPDQREPPSSAVDVWGLGRGVQQRISRRGVRETAPEIDWGAEPRRSSDKRHRASAGGLGADDAEFGELGGPPPARQAASRAEPRGSSGDVIIPGRVSPVPPPRPSESPVPPPPADEATADGRSDEAESGSGGGGGPRGAAVGRGRAGVAPGRVRFATAVEDRPPDEEGAPLPEPSMSNRSVVPEVTIAVGDEESMARRSPSPSPQPAPPTRGDGSQRSRASNAGVHASPLGQRDGDPSETGSAPREAPFTHAAMGTRKDPAAPVRIVAAAEPAPGVPDRWKPVASVAPTSHDRRESRETGNARGRPRKRSPAKRETATPSAEGGSAPADAGRRELVSEALARARRLRQELDRALPAPGDASRTQPPVVEPRPLVLREKPGGVLDVAVAEGDSDALIAAALAAAFESEPDTADLLAGAADNDPNTLWPFDSAAAADLDIEALLAAGPLNRTRHDETAAAADEEAEPLRLDDERTRDPTKQAEDGDDLEDDGAWIAGLLKEGSEMHDAHEKAAKAAEVSLRYPTLMSLGREIADSLASASVVRVTIDRLVLSLAAVGAKSAGRARRRSPASGVTSPSSVATSPKAPGSSRRSPRHFSSSARWTVEYSLPSSDTSGRRGQLVAISSRPPEASSSRRRGAAHSTSSDESRRVHFGSTRDEEVRFTESGVDAWLAGHMELRCIVDAPVRRGRRQESHGHGAPLVAGSAQVPLRQLLLSTDATIDGVATIRDDNGVDIGVLHFTLEMVLGGDRAPPAARTTLRLAGAATRRVDPIPERTLSFAAEPDAQAVSEQDLRTRSHGDGELTLAVHVARVSGVPETDVNPHGVLPRGARHTGFSVRWSVAGFKAKRSGRDAYYRQLRGAHALDGPFLTSEINDAVVDAVDAEPAQVLARVRDNVVVFEVWTCYRARDGPNEVLVGLANVPASELAAAVAFVFPQLTTHVDGVASGSATTAAQAGGGCVSVSGRWPVHDPVSGADRGTLGATVVLGPHEAALQVLRRVQAATTIQSAGSSWRPRARATAPKRADATVVAASGGRDVRGGGTPSAPTSPAHEQAASRAQQSPSPVGSPEQSPSAKSTTSRQSESSPVTESAPQSPASVGRGAVSTGPAATPEREIRHAGAVGESAMDVSLQSSPGGAEEHSDSDAGAEASRSEPEIEVEVAATLQRGLTRHQFHLMLSHGCSVVPPSGDRALLEAWGRGRWGCHITYTFPGSWGAQRVVSNEEVEAERDADPSSGDDVAASYAALDIHAHEAGAGSSEVGKRHVLWWADVARDSSHAVHTIDIAADANVEAFLPVSARGLELQVWRTPVDSAGVTTASPARSSVLAATPQPLFIGSAFLPRRQLVRAVKEGGSLPLQLALLGASRFTPESEAQAGRRPTLGVVLSYKRVVGAGTPPRDRSPPGPTQRHTVISGAGFVGVTRVDEVKLQHDKQVESSAADSTDQVAAHDADASLQEAGDAPGAAAPSAGDTPGAAAPSAAGDGEPGATGAGLAADDVAAPASPKRSVVTRSLRPASAVVCVQVGRISGVPDVLPNSPGGTKCVASVHLRMFTGDAGPGYGWASRHSHDFRGGTVNFEARFPVAVGPAFIASLAESPLELRVLVGGQRATAGSLASGDVRETADDAEDAVAVARPRDAVEAALVRIPLGTLRHSKRGVGGWFDLERSTDHGGRLGRADRPLKVRVDVFFAHHARVRSLPVVGAGLDDGSGGGRDGGGGHGRYDGGRDGGPGKDGSHDAAPGDSRAGGDGGGGGAGAAAGGADSRQHAVSADALGSPSTSEALDSSSHSGVAAPSLPSEGETPPPPPPPPTDAPGRAGGGLELDSPLFSRKPAERVSEADGEGWEEVDSPIPPPPLTPLPERRDDASADAASARDAVPVHSPDAGGDAESGSDSDGDSAVPQPSKRWTPVALRNIHAAAAAAAATEAGAAAVSLAGVAEDDDDEYGREGNPLLSFSESEGDPTPTPVPPMSGNVSGHAALGQLLADLTSLQTSLAEWVDIGKSPAAAAAEALETDRAQTLEEERAIDAVASDVADHLTLELVVEAAHDELAASTAAALKPSGSCDDGEDWIPPPAGPKPKPPSAEGGSGGEAASPSRTSQVTVHAAASFEGHSDGGAHMSGSSGGHRSVHGSPDRASHVSAASSGATDDDDFLDVGDLEAALAEAAELEARISFSRVDAAVATFLDASEDALDASADESAGAAAAAVPPAASAAPPATSAAEGDEAGDADFSDEDMDVVELDSSVVSVDDRALDFSSHADDAAGNAVLDAGGLGDVSDLSRTHVSASVSSISSAGGDDASLSSSWSSSSSSSSDSGDGAAAFVRASARVAPAVLDSPVQPSPAVAAASPPRPLGWTPAPPRRRNVDAAVQVASPPRAAADVSSSEDTPANPIVSGADAASPMATASGTLDAAIDARSAPAGAEPSATAAKTDAGVTGAKPSPASSPRAQATPPRRVGGGKLRSRELAAELDAAAAMPSPTLGLADIARVLQRSAASPSRVVSVNKPRPAAAAAAAKSAAAAAAAPWAELARAYAADPEASRLARVLAGRSGGPALRTSWSGYASDD